MSQNLLSLVLIFYLIASHFTIYHNIHQPLLSRKLYYAMMISLQYY